MKFKKSKYQALHLGSKKTMQWDRLRSHRLGESFAEKRLGVQVDKLNMSQQHAFAEKVNYILGCASSSEATVASKGILPLHSALVRSHLECGVHFSAPQNKENTCVLESSGGLQIRWLGSWCTRCTKQD